MRAIEGVEKVKAIYGDWPSFHDAEVWGLSFERVPLGFSVVAVIHVFQSTSDVDAKGYCVLKDHSRVRIRFDCCSDVSLDGFNQQNVLFGLDISEPENAPLDCRFQVRLDTSYGLSGTLRCRNIVVEAADRWIPPFGVYAQPDATPGGDRSVSFGDPRTCGGLGSEVKSEAGDATSKTDGDAGVSRPG